MTTQGAVRSGVTVSVLCLAQLRDAFGASAIAFTLPAGATGRDVLAVLRARMPSLAPLLDVSRLAVNNEYIHSEAPLRDGDDVIVIPPVSGG